VPEWLSITYCHADKRSGGCESSAVGRGHGFGTNWQAFNPCVTLGGLRVGCDTRISREGRSLSLLQRYVPDDLIGHCFLIFSEWR